MGLRGEEESNVIDERLIYLRRLTIGPGGLIINEEIAALRSQ